MAGTSSDSNSSSTSCGDFLMVRDGLVSGFMHATLILEQTGLMACGAITLLVVVVMIGS